MYRGRDDVDRITAEGMHFLEMLVCIRSRASWCYLQGGFYSERGIDMKPVPWKVPPRSLFKKTPMPAFKSRVRNDMYHDYAQEQLRALKD